MTANTKPSCPKCGDVRLILFRSMFLKTCSACNTDIAWPLDKGQQPLIQSNRASKRVSKA